jgi:quinol monooxygenase YgiN
MKITLRRRARCSSSRARCTSTRPHAPTDLRGCKEVVAAARQAAGCLDFALSPDLLDPGRINVYEHRRSQDELDRFRGSGPSDEQSEALLEVRVDEYLVST